MDARCEVWLVWGRKFDEENGCADVNASTPRPLELDRQGNLDETKPLLGSIFGISIFSHICLPPSKTSPTRTSNNFSPLLDNSGLLRRRTVLPVVQRSGESCFTEKDAFEFCMNPIIYIQPVPSIYRYPRLFQDVDSRWCCWVILEGLGDTSLVWLLSINGWYRCGHAGILVMSLSI